MFAPCAVTTGVSCRVRRVIWSCVSAPRRVTKTVSPGPIGTVALVTAPTSMFGAVASGSVVEIAASSARATAMLCGRLWRVQSAAALGVAEFFVTMIWSGVLYGLFP